MGAGVEVWKHLTHSPTRRSQPNQGVQLTACSVRSYVAPASGSS